MAPLGTGEREADATWTAPRTAPCARPAAAPAAVATALPTVIPSEEVRPMASMARVRQVLIWCVMDCLQFSRRCASRKEAYSAVT